MSRASDWAKAGLIASSLSLLLSQSAVASMVNIHVPSPSIHIRAPSINVRTSTVHVRTPVVHLRTAAVHLKRVSVKNHRGDLPKGGRTGKTVPPVSWIAIGALKTTPNANVAVPVLVPIASAVREAANWFVGTTCSTVGQGFDATLTITQQLGTLSGNSVEVSGVWNGAKFTGTIIKNADGTYTLTITQMAGASGPVDDTATFIWQSGPNGGHWTLTNGTMTGPQGQQLGTWSVGNCSTSS